MKSILNDLCSAHGGADRRRKLEEVLRSRFPGRLVVESRDWGIDSRVSETVNFLVPFGRQKGHLVLGAHYDAVPGAPGANDNGAAVVQLLESASRLQAFSAAGALEHDVTFCFWDHEELFGSPFMGSKLYLENQAGALPARAVVYDVSGVGEFFVSGWDETGLVLDLPTRSTPPSDNTVLSQAGIPATLICALPGHELHDACPATWRTLHTPMDTADRVERQTLMAGADLAMAIVERFQAA